MRVLLSLFFLLAFCRINLSGYTVSELLKIADTNNLTLKQYASLTNAMEKKIAVESSWEDTMASYELMDLPLKDFNPNGDMVEHKFMLKQELPFFGKNDLRRRVAELDYLNSGAELDEKKLMLRKMLLERVLENYFNMKVLQNRKSETELLKKLSEIVRVQYSTGKAMLANVVELDIRQSQAQTMLLMSSNMQESLKYEISSVLNIDEKDWNVEYSNISYDTGKITNLEVESLLKAALTNFPPAKMKRNDIEMRDKEAGLSRLDFLPDVSLGLGYDFKPSPMPENLLTLEIEFGLPIFSFDKKAKEIEMNEQKKKGAEFEYLAYQNELKYALKKNLADLKTGIDQANLMEQKVLRQSEMNINTLVSAYSVEKVEFDMLLNSIIMTYDLQGQYYEYLKKVYSTLFDIEVLTGQKLYTVD